MDTSLTEEELQSLSSDPYEAFFQYEELITAKIKPFDSSTKFKTYLALISDFCEVYSIDSFANVLSSKGVPRDKWLALTEKVRREKNKIMLMRFKKTQPRDLTNISVPEDYKKEAHNLINKIRDIIGKSEIEEKKKDTILRRLNALAVEIDTSKTQTQHYVGVVLDITQGIKQGARDLKEALPLVERLTELFSDAKALEDGTADLAIEHQKKLPPPEPK